MEIKPLLPNQYLFIIKNRYTVFDRTVYHLTLGVSYNDTTKKLFLRRFKHVWLIIHRNDPYNYKNGLKSLKIALKETYLILDTTVQEWQSVRTTHRGKILTVRSLYSCLDRGSTPLISTSNSAFTVHIVAVSSFKLSSVYYECKIKTLPVTK